MKNKTKQTSCFKKVDKNTACPVISGCQFRDNLVRTPSSPVGISAETDESPRAVFLSVGRVVSTSVCTCNVSCDAAFGHEQDKHATPSLSISLIFGVKTFGSAVAIPQCSGNLSATSRPSIQRLTGTNQWRRKLSVASLLASLRGSIPDEATARSLCTPADQMRASLRY